jgi:VanZ family protein
MIVQKVSKVLFILFLLVVMFLSVYNFGTEIHTGNDKINHCVAFFMFALLFYFAFRNDGFFTIIGFGMGYGLLIEVVQHFLPYRSAEAGDLFADIIGLGIGILVVKFLSIRNKKRARALSVSDADR